MTNTIRSANRGGIGAADWIDSTDPTRDGFAPRIKADQAAIRQQNRDRRHKDTAQLHKLIRDTEAARDAVWHASARRDVYALPSW